MKKQRVLLAGLLVAGITLFAGCNVNVDSIRYNVDFYVDGEIYQSVGTDGKNIEMPKNPTKEGYQFDGWYTQENGEGELITLYSLLNQPLSEDIRLSIHAHFLEEITVSFETGTDEVIADAEYVEGDTFSAVTPSVIPENMLFDGWFTDQKCTQKWDTETELSKDITLYAGWISKYVDVTYVYNMEGVENDVKQVARYEKLNRVTPESTQEQTFIGWYTDKNLTQAWDENDTIDDHITLYAKWLNKYVTVTYDFQHESLENKTVKIERGQKATNLTPESIPPFHTFLGWGKYSYGYVDWNFNNPVETDLTLYARWDDRTGAYVHVTYVYIGGYEYFGSTKIGSLVEDRTPYQNLKAGERFVGWFLDENCTQPWDILNDLADKTEITLYAKAEKIPYSITFDTQGMQSLHKETLYYGDRITLPKLYKEDYYLSAWQGTKTDGSTFLVNLYNDSFSYTHDEESNVCFTPVFKSIFVFEKSYLQEGYVLTELSHVAQETVRIPAVYDNLPVIRIQERACFNNNGFSKLVIPDSVTHVEQEAFAACYNLTEVAFGSGVTDIAYAAFNDCRMLTTVTFTGNSLKSVGNNVFDGSAIKSLSFPDSLETLGYLVCSQLSSIYLGNGLKEITYGICSCPELKEIRLPASLEILPENAFSGCNLLIYAEAESQPSGWHENWNKQNLPVIWNANNAKTTTINDMLFVVNDGEATLVRYSGAHTQLTVPEQIEIDGVQYPVTQFAPNAFFKAPIQNLSLPNSLEKVVAPQFIGCNNLVYHVENGVKYLGNAQNPYLLLKDLTADQNVLTVPAQTRIILGHDSNYYYSTYSIRGLAFETGSQLKYIGPNFYYWSAADTNIYLPSGVKYIATGAFSYNYVNVFVPEESAPETWDLGWNALNIYLSNPCNVYYGVDKDATVTVNEATYFLHGDEIILLKLECTTDTYVLPETVTVDGKEYPLTQILPSALSYIQSNLIYLAIPETVTELDTSDVSSSHTIQTYLMGTNNAPEDYAPSKSNILYGVTKQNYIIDNKVHYIAFGNYAMAYKFIRNDASITQEIFVLPKTVTVNGTPLPISHISRSFISDLNYVSILFQETVTNIPTGTSQTYGTQFFTAHDAAPQSWETDWNEKFTSLRPTTKEYYPLTFGVTGVDESAKTYTFMANGEQIQQTTAPFMPSAPTPTVSGKYFWGWYDNAEFTGSPIQFPYVGIDKTFYARLENEQIQDGKSQDTAIVLTLGSYMPVNITTPGQTVYFKLTVEQEGSYLFKSRGDCDTFGKIYYMRKVVSVLREEIVASADGGGSGENFSMSATLQQKTYYFAVKLTEATQTGSFEIIVSAV